MNSVSLTTYAKESALQFSLILCAAFFGGLCGYYRVGYVIDCIVDYLVHCVLDYVRRMACVLDCLVVCWWYASPL